MNHARLIKKDEILERERQASEIRIPKPSVTRSAMKTAQAWVTEHKTSDRVNAREQFAALFS